MATSTTSSSKHAPLSYPPRSESQNSSAPSSVLPSDPLDMSRAMTTTVTHARTETPTADFLATSNYTTTSTSASSYPYKTFEEKEDKCILLVPVMPSEWGILVQAREPRPGFFGKLRLRGKLSSNALAVRRNSNGSIMSRSSNLSEYHESDPGAGYGSGMGLGLVEEGSTDKSDAPGPTMEKQHSEEPPKSTWGYKPPSCWLHAPTTSAAHSVSPSPRGSSNTSPNLSHRSATSSPRSPVDFFPSSTLHPNSTAATDHDTTLMRTSSWPLDAPPRPLHRRELSTYLAHASPDAKPEILKVTLAEYKRYFVRPSRGEGDVEDARRWIKERILLCINEGGTWGAGNRGFLF